MSVRPPEQTAVAASPSRLAAFDAWMTTNPWHPRLVPFLAYILFLPAAQWARTWWPPLQPLLYGAQLIVVVALLWRYRHWIRELTWRFHWLAVPVGVALCAAWIGLGHGMVQLAPGWFAPEPGPSGLERMPEPWRAFSLGLRLLGMTLVVPMFEELFVRSACLRGFHSPRKTWIGLVQAAADMPGLGDWLGETRYGQRMQRYPFMFTRQLREWPVGRLTLFGVCASTLIFTASHVPRDWPGCLVCGVAWCALLWWTNDRGRGSTFLNNEPTPHASPQVGALPGLGPIVWSHAITNALLWLWCVSMGDWMFL